jgi:hypothetical protein
MGNSIPAESVLKGRDNQTRFIGSKNYRITYRTTAKPASDHRRSGSGP